MPQFKPRDSDFAQRVASCFRDESASFLWGGQLVAVAPGKVAVGLPIGGDSDSRHEALLRSRIATLLDEACLLAGLSLASAGDRVGMAEYKLNFLATEAGENLVAEADVVRPGRTITVCRADALLDGRLAARMLATLRVSRPS